VITDWIYSSKVSLWKVKSIDTLVPIHQAQLLTYLRLAGLPVGLVINFNVDQLVKGIKRVINPRANEIEAEAVRLAAKSGLP
jgi:GxxExxY protein